MAGLFIGLLVATDIRARRQSVMIRARYSELRALLMRTDGDPRLALPPSRRNGGAAELVGFLRARVAELAPNAVIRRDGSAIRVVARPRNWLEGHLSGDRVILTNELGNWYLVDWIYGD